MKKIKLNGKVVELYDAIEDLPITRFHKYNKYLLIDAGIGSDLSDFDRHAEKVSVYIERGEKDKAVTEMQNMRQNLYFVQSGLNPRHMAFAVLVKSIDGVESNDMSDDAIQNVLKQLGDVPTKEVSTYLDIVKKKIDDELRAYFPALFDDASSKEYYDKLIQRTKIVLNTIITGIFNKDIKRKLKTITDDLVTFFNPQPFNDGDNSEVKYDRQFENMCLILTKNLHTDVKRFTVLEFYNAYEFTKEQARKLRISAKR